MTLFHRARQTFWLTAGSPRSFAAASWAALIVFARPCHLSFSRLQRKLCTPMSGSGDRHALVDGRGQPGLDAAHAEMPIMPIRFGSTSGRFSSTSISRHRSQTVS